MCKHLVQLEPAAEGRWGSIVWAVEASGKVPAREFFQALEDRNAAKMQALFNRLADDGFIRNDEKFKKLCNRGGHALWELKSFQLRFLGAFGKNRRFLVALGLKKKSNAHKSRDFERAARILSEHLSRCEGGA